MIQHILKIIWNERKVNGWILLEFLLVFCILWFCFDYLYFMGKSYVQPVGFDTNHVYYLRMNIKDPKIVQETDIDENETMQTIIDRIKRYPGVENVSVSSGGLPYALGYNGGRYQINNDSVWHTTRDRTVTKAYFDVFRINVKGGNLNNWGDKTYRNQVLISPTFNGLFGEYPKKLYPLESVHTIQRTREKEPFHVIGHINKIKSNYFGFYVSSVMRPLLDIHHYNEITIRVHPEADKDFAEKFSKDMRKQLSLGPFYMINITPLKEMEQFALKYSGVNDNLNSVYSITTFLILNIFLGVIGTFWYRTQSRQGEIGLRIAVGATKRKVKNMLYLETLTLLFIASVIGANICVNLAQSDLLQLIGIPMADQIQRENRAQYFIDYGMTFLFLGIISFFAVWYPARQASEVQPAESLRTE